MTITRYPDRMSLVNGWDEVSAAAVHATVDAATLAWHPNLGADIHYAFVHVTHGWIEPWWEANLGYITDAAHAQVGGQRHVTDWACFASLQAALCMGFLPDPPVDLIVGLAVPAAKHMNATEYPPVTVPDPVQVEPAARDDARDEAVYWATVDDRASRIQVGETVMALTDVTEGWLFPRRVIQAGASVTVTDAPRRGDITIRCGEDIATVSRRRVAAWMVAAHEAVTSWAY